MRMSIGNTMNETNKIRATRDEALETVENLKHEIKSLKRQNSMLTSRLEASESEASATKDHYERAIEKYKSQIQMKDRDLDVSPRRDSPPLTR